MLLFGGLLISSWPTLGQPSSDIPFDLNFAGVTVHLTEPGRQAIQQEITRLYSDRTALRRDVESLRQLTPLLEPLLADRQLPLDFRYAVLPFDDTTGAYWNLTPSLADSLNLRMDNRVDERYNPLLTSAAVAVRLRSLYETSGNYVQALLLYSQSAPLTPPSHTKADPTYLLLDAQSPPFIWKLLARKLTFEREEPTLRLALNYVLYAFPNGAGYSLHELGRRLKLPDDRFHPFNEWLRSDTTRIPADKRYLVLIRVTTDEFPVVKQAAEAGSPTALTQFDIGFPELTKLPSRLAGGRFPVVFYQINDRLGVQAQSCDNLITLAYYGNLRINQFLKYNDLTNQDVVRPGELYYLRAKAKRAKVPFHVVRRNQTMRDIAGLYGVRLKSLLRFNRIEPTQRVQTGRIVWLQHRRPRNQPVEYRQLPADEPPRPDSAQAQLVPPAANSITNSSTVTTTAATTAAADTSVAGKSQEQPAVPTPIVNGAGSGQPVNTLRVTPAQPPRLHIVRPHQTYYAIARLYGITVAQLYARNKLSARLPLRIGQKLIVDMAKKPPTGLVAPKRTLTKPKPANTGLVNTFTVEPTETIVYYVVKPGQTVYRIALINHVSIPDLMRWNKLRNYTLEVGQRLIIHHRIK